MRQIIFVTLLSDKAFDESGTDICIFYEYIHIKKEGKVDVIIYVFSISTFDKFQLQPVN